MPISQSNGWNRLFDAFIKVLVFIIRIFAKVQNTSNDKKD